MKIAVIGANGKQGSLIVEEALKRGIDVTAIVRDKSKIKDINLKVIEKDAMDLSAEDIKDFDVLVNAFGAKPGHETDHVELGRKLITVMAGTSKTRLIVVGGAGSLFVDEEKKVKLLDTKEFPKEYYETAYNQGRNLEDLQNSQNVKWTFLSPAAFFDPQGKRTGNYKLGKDNMILNSENESYISYADYAIALVDEIENPIHNNKRFTVVGEHK